VAPRGAGMKPNFLIIGAPRSGTTSLFHYLRAHPGVFTARGKELHFFDLEWDRGWDWYQRCFAGVRGESAVGEATPSYMCDSVAIERIAKHLPDARLIAILRDPVDRAYSHYWLNRSRGRERMSFIDAVRAEPARRATDDKKMRFWYSYVDQGRYLPQLLRVADRFSPDRLFVALFDDLLLDPRDLFIRLAQFLDIDASTVPDVVGSRVNEFRTYRSLRLRKTTARLPKPLVDGIAKLNSRVVDYPTASRYERSFLLEQIAEENLALGQWLGRDLSSWNTVSPQQRTASA
jgi:hypothetical protein